MYCGQIDNAIYEAIIYTFEYYIYFSVKITEF